MYEKTSRAHRTLPVSMPLCQQAVWARVVDWGRRHWLDNGRVGLTA